MRIWIDNGHGENTLGKCSPDKRFREWSYTREIARRVVAELKSQGYDAELLTPEDRDVSLSERVRRANAVRDSIVISIHNNAAGGDGKWHNATGWSGFVAPNASQNSKRLAQILLEEAHKRGLQGNRSIPKEKYWVGNFAIIRDTKMPAVLTENLFQDSQEDVKLLESEEGKKKIVDLHVEGIKRYLSEKK